MTVRRRVSRIASAAYWCLVLVLLSGAVIAVYQPFLRDFFVLDDFIWLHAARTPDAGQFMRDAFGFPTPTPFSVPTPFWRPLIDVYFFLAWRLYGDNQIPYHVTNLAVHAANATLLAVLAWQISRSRLVALLTALLWSLFPAYDYAVVWISEATELFATFWYLLALTLFAATLRHERPRLLYLFGALAATIMALLAKQSSATLPVVMLLLALVIAPPRGRADLLRILRLVLPFATVTAAYVAFLYPHDYQTSSTIGIYAIGPHVFANLWDFLLRLTWPFTTPGEHVDALLPRLATVSFLTGGVVALLLRRRPLGFAFLCTVLMLVPYALFPAGTESRYLYLAAAPFALFLMLLARAAAGFLAAAAGGPAVAGVVVATIALAVPLLGRETRTRQVWLHQQAAAYEQMVTEVPAVCGRLPSGSRLEIIGSPTLDLWGDSTRMALGMSYPGVHVERRPSVETAPSAACAVRYEAGRYLRLPDEDRVGLGPIVVSTPPRPATSSGGPGHAFGITAPTAILSPPTTPR